MDIFNSNRRLEELTMYALDWGLFLRHDSEGGIAPFMYLQNGKDKFTRVLMTDGDPMEFAKSILQKEENPFEQFVIGFEGYLRDDKNNRVDSIIVQGFDISQDKGAALGQMFNPKENGGFRKIDKTIFLGNPELIISKKENNNADYSIEEIGFNAIAMSDDNNLTSYVAVFVHQNPSVVANTIKRFLRSKIGGEKKDELSGKFELNIPAGQISNDDFLKFLVTNSIKEEIQSENSKIWSSQTKREFDIVCKNGDNIIFKSSDYVTEELNSTVSNSGTTGYETCSQQELENEYYSILSIPNARTSVEALTKMTNLMLEFKNRGLTMPNSTSPQRQTEKKWWQFWK